jgi:hypothetical protein
VDDRNGALFSGSAVFRRTGLSGLLIASAIMHFQLELSVARGIVEGIAGGVVVSRWKVAEG